MNDTMITEYRDIETGTLSPKTFNIRRKWAKIPRAIRLYMMVGSVLLLLFFFFFTLPNADSVHENVKHSPVIVDVPELELPIPSKVSIVEDNSDKQQQQQENIVQGPVASYDELTAEIFKSIKLNAQQKKIKAALQHSWNGYRKFAWGQDHLLPISKTGNNWFGIGLTILDSLDTLLMAGMTEEYEEALDWVKNTLSFDVNRNVNCFETTIRALGGLLSAYHITKDRILLDKANDLGGRLVHCFDSQTKVPYSDVNLKRRRASSPAWSSDSSLSEVSSMQLEFRDLSYVTNNKTYEEKSFTTSKHLHSLVVEGGSPILPMFINPNTGRLSRSVLTLGARADSYYEYLYKQYLQVKEPFFLQDWIASIDKIHEKMWRSTVGKLQLKMIGEIFHNDEFSPKMDHLVCFLSGTLALGYHHEGKNNKEKFQGHLQMAEDLARTCHYMYNLTETGLSPEIAYFGLKEGESEFIVRPADKHNLLRPEFVESLFFLYHITGKQIYRDWGAQVFDAFEKYSKVSTGGYTTLKDVRNPLHPFPTDKMESFWIAETLKYLYLLFTDDRAVIDALLNRYVFNTEAHILPRRVF